MMNIKKLYVSFFFLSFFLLCFACKRGIAAGILLPSEQEEVTITVTGEVDMHLPDRKNSARKNAIQEAVRYILGQTVRSETLVENFTLIYDRIFTETKGFVKKVKPIGNYTIKNGSYLQKYSITVHTKALDKSIVKSSIESKIDLPALYTSVGSPRIAMVLTEVIVDENGQKNTRSPDIHSESAVQTYFKKKNPNFTFKSLPMLVQGISHKPDWIALGKKNNFDIVIIGTIETKLVLKSTKNIRGTGNVIKIPMYRYSSELTWNIINVSLAERVSTIHRFFDRGSKTKGTSETTASKYAKDTVINMAIPDLFSDLMLTWVDTVYYTPYEILFTDTESAQGYAIQTQLRKLPLVTAEEVISFGSVDGQLLYKSNLQGSLSQITHLLSETFKEYKVIESRQGRIVMAKSGFDAQIFNIEIMNVSFLESDTIYEQLMMNPGIEKVSPPTLRNSIARYSVNTRLTGRKLARLLEKQLNLRVISFQENALKARKQ